MPLATHHGVTFHVQELGSGPTVVMLHGLLVGSMATWYFTAAPHLAVRRRVVLFDLRGHGKSERVKTGYDVATMAGDLEAIAGGPATLVGHSYGAVVALHYALKHPEKVHKLVLVEAPLPPSRLEELDAFLGKRPDEMAESLPSVLKDALGRKGRQATRFVESLRFLVSETSLMADLRKATDIPDDALRALKVPTLLLYGTESSCRPVGERLARGLPDARLTLLEGGHFLPIERPLGPDILEFLDA
jgi:pimeloyl-ACP methyl ester carboxylesterase